MGTVARRATNSICFGCGFGISAAAAFAPKVGSDLTLRVAGPRDLVYCRLRRVYPGSNIMRGNEE